ncbi:MAG TPA: hypothetical protein VK081_02520, partial [Planctomycetota bacterium]|nr:hypothetical protein [Planctomycetota bacterium]
LVVGVPNFRFGETISPLSLERTMRNVLRQAAPDLMGQGNAISNALFSQRAGEHVRAAESGDGLQVEPELAGTGEHDMFVHPVPRLSLPRGARATVPLWTAEPALRHLYTFDVRRVHDVGRPRPAAVQTSPLALAKNEVWHQLELTNGGPMPWTTGPALVLKGTLPLSQELLTYTPPGARTLLPLTVAVNVRGTYEEEQTAVQPNALTWNRSVYARVTLRGKARVANHERHAVDVRVRASVGGRVLQADGDAKVVLRGHDPADWQGASFDARPNGHSDVTWNVRLEPGAEQELTFEFEVFQS